MSKNHIITNIRFPDEIMAYLEFQARKENITMTHLINEVIFEKMSNMSAENYTLPQLKAIEKNMRYLLNSLLKENNEISKKIYKSIQMLLEKERLDGDNPQLRDKLYKIADSNFIEFVLKSAPVPPRL